MELGKAFEEQKDALGDIMSALRIADEFVSKATVDNDTGRDDKNAAVFAMRQLKELIDLHLRAGNRHVRYQSVTCVTPGRISRSTSSPGVTSPRSRRAANMAFIRLRDTLPSASKNFLPPRKS